ncbi:threonine-phosphate decarboxylase CobD [Primorskyibacter marinus]|uniref:threonine-phosphate decarboxylase CobD n=1 Tax=Primorskyibacter marinus TaxID=1977320 RepID=UPI000E307A14|nr:threonine-phosphate decarboxylase CobD [Primorskyibacter marinus]
MAPTDQKTPRDHGGNLDAAIRHYGGRVDQWIDLSTGINPISYPVPQISPSAWENLPRRSDMQRLSRAAQKALGTKAALTALAGAQGAIQIMGRLRSAGDARILSPTYNEHGAALRAAGWQVTQVSSLAALQDADLAVVVNPNNPDGKCHDPASLRNLARTVGMLIVDESFVDVQPELSLAPVLHEIDNVLVLRSFGKFFGLAGMRLGFALGPEPWIAQLSDLAGPWPVSGPAIEIAIDAYANSAWQIRTTERLTLDALRLDALASKRSLPLVGGTPLFRTYAAPDAAALQRALARHHIWTRIFPYDPNWIRLGLPGTDADWKRLERAFGH